MTFDISLGDYIIRGYDLDHTGHLVNYASLSSHVTYEKHLSSPEIVMLRNLGRICYSSLQSKISLLRSFPNRTYDIDMIYRVIKRLRIEVYGIASDCVVKLCVLGNSHK